MNINGGDSSCMFVVVITVLVVDMFFGCALIFGGVKNYRVDSDRSCGLFRRFSASTGTSTIRWYLPVDSLSAVLYSGESCICRRHMRREVVSLFYTLLHQHKNLK